MELAERVEQLEQQVKTFRPELHFPVTATLEHRVRWLEIVFGEMKARDNHGVYAETPLEGKLEKILGNTIYIRPDRITLHSLTADPASVVAGDLWFRSDVGKAKQAIDSMVANARLLRREGDIVPAAEIANLDTAKITSGRFPLSRLGWTASKLLLGAGAGSDPTEIDAAFGLAFFGDGSDGNVTISGNTTLTRDMFYNNLTVNSGITLNTGGYRIFVKETLTNNGTIARNGNAGGNGGNGVTAGAGGAGGTAGAALASANLPGGVAGQIGGVGGHGVNHTLPGAGTIGSSQSKCIGGNGTSGGAGGNGSSGDGGPGGGGGAAGGAGTATATTLPPRTIPLCIYMTEFYPNAVAFYVAAAGSGSGGGGGYGGEGLENWGGGGGGGGGSGGVGGIVFICAKTIINTSGTISANGGNGGNGGSGGGGLGGGGVGGGGGGGAGGNGGVLVLIYNTLATGTEAANGGNLGTGIGGGNNGIAGSAGTVVKIVN